MPARILLVLDEPGFGEKAAQLLSGAGYDVAAISDPHAALDALEGARTIELLVTCADYGPNRPNGIALARMARLKRPGIKVIFVGTEDTAHLTENLAGFLRIPVAVDDVVGAVTQMLTSGEIIQPTSVNTLTLEQGAT